jgi:hypothetical protein
MAGRGITDNNAACRELAVSLEAYIRGTTESPHSVVRGEPFLSCVRHFPGVEAPEESGRKPSSTGPNLKRVRFLDCAVLH